MRKGPQRRTACPDRIMVVGCSGSGKSTLGVALSRRLGIPFHATDGLYWSDDWRPTPAASVTAWLHGIARQDAWLLDGNFTEERDLIWARAEMIVWLDLPLVLVMWRVARRNLGWWARRTSVWGDRRMPLHRALSGMRHAWRSHGAKRRAYPGYLAALAALLGVETVVLRSAGAVRDWLATMGAERRRA